MSRLVDWLKDNPRQKFAIFGIGSIGLMCGLIAIVMAEYRMEAGDLRNNVVIGALILCVAGGICALTGYIGLSFGRIARFFEDDKHVK